MDPSRRALLAGTGAALSGLAGCTALPPNPLTAKTLSVPEGSDVWPMRRFDVRRTNVNSDAPGPGREPSVVQTYYASRPVVVGSDGEVRWRDASGDRRPASVVTDEFLLRGRSKMEVAATTHGGEDAWTLNFPTVESDGATWNGRPEWLTPVGDRLYAIDGNRTVFGGVPGGRPRWHAKTDPVHGRSDHGLAVAGETLVASGTESYRPSGTRGEGRFHHTSLVGVGLDGERRWTFETTGYPWTVATDDRRAFVPVSTGEWKSGEERLLANHLFVVDTRTGDARARRPLNVGWNRGMALFHAAVVVCGTEAIICLERDSLEERWRVPVDDSDGVVGGGGVVFAGSNRGVRALSLEDGSERWRFDSDESRNEPVAVAGANVYVSATDVVYALGPK
ncbi:PQQ repeat-containing protein [Halogeometricum pallidum JCM 14848]|uniref:PQQ repeat-containing protein n=1 Tax=Halogeometricum pallidum JCM 14848 TaxID=1227487 RepID=M0DI25_HALPD|nr:PQQ-binding-like beta-propeller repeat protein [Halogeometricum pallidum]ELZ34448.1 PQQ repeat-containing protein [Halogeometricum pallidum JCM 14848]